MNVKTSNKKDFFRGAFLLVLLLLVLEVMCGTVLQLHTGRYQVHTHIKVSYEVQVGSVQCVLCVLARLFVPKESHG